jgi:lycopene cyclase domain-containing protein
MKGFPVYLILDLFTFCGPLILSFDKKVAYYKNFRFLFPAIFATAIFFIVWDVIFTKNGVWNFNPDYLCGLWFFNLPLEEVLFFIVVPYASVFIYFCLNAYFPHNLFIRYEPVINKMVLFVLAIACTFTYGRDYTFYTSVFTLGLLFWLAGSKVKWLPDFWRAYLVHLIPFFLINGVLTALPVVIYNNQENLAFRIYTIPIEDTVYSMLLLLMNISIMHYLEKRAKTAGNFFRSSAVQS